MLIFCLTLDKPKASTASTSANETGKQSENTGAVVTAQGAKAETVTTTVVRSLATTTTVSSSTASIIGSNVTKVTASDKDDELVDVVSVSTADTNTKPAADASLKANGDMTVTGSAPKDALPSTATPQKDPSIPTVANATAGPLPPKDASKTDTNGASASTTSTIAPNATMPGTRASNAGKDSLLDAKTSEAKSAVVPAPNSAENLTTKSKATTVAPDASNADAVSAPVSADVTGTAPAAANTTSPATSTTEVITNAAGVDKTELHKSDDSTVLPKSDKARSTSPSSMLSSTATIVPSLANDMSVTSQQSEDQKRTSTPQQSEDISGNGDKLVEVGLGAENSKKIASDNTADSEKEQNKSSSISEKNIVPGTVDSPAEAKTIAENKTQLMDSLSTGVDKSNKDESAEIRDNLNENDSKMEVDSTENEAVSTEPSKEAVSVKKVSETNDIEMKTDVAEEQKTGDLEKKEEANMDCTNHGTAMDVDVPKSVGSNEIQAKSCEVTEIMKDDKIPQSSSDEVLVQDKASSVGIEPSVGSNTGSPVSKGNKPMVLEIGETASKDDENESGEVVTSPKEQSDDKNTGHALLSPTRTVGDVIAKLKENDFDVKASTTAESSSGISHASENTAALTTTKTTTTTAATTTAEVGLKEKRSLDEETQRILDKLLKKVDGELVDSLEKSQSQAVLPTSAGPQPVTTVSSISDATSVSTVASASNNVSVASASTEQKTAMPALAQTQPVQSKASLQNSTLQSGAVKLPIIASKAEQHVSMPAVQLPLLAPTVSSIPMPALAQVQPLRPTAKVQTPAAPKPTTSRPVAIAPAPASTQTSIPIGLAASQISNAAVLKALATGNAFQSGGIQIIQASPGQFIIRSNITNTANQQQNQRAVLLGNTAIMLSKVGAGGQIDGTGNAQRTMQNIQAGEMF